MTLYQAVVPLRGGAEADRQAAFGEALKVAAIQASGRRDAATDARIVAAAGDPSRYVQQYSTTSDRMLKVGFDGHAMEQLLAQAGLPLWPSERPVTTIYLYTAATGARPAGAGERTPERADVERAAQLRGMPVAWAPEQLDSAMARANAANQDPTRAVLVGVASGAGYEWTFGHAGQVSRTEGPLAEGVNFAADTLASRYAPASTRGITSATVRIGNVPDVRAYAALTTYLQGLSLVRSLAVDEFAGDTVQLRVGLRGDLGLLRRIVALDAEHLAAADSPGTMTTGTTAPDFVWRP